MATLDNSDFTEIKQIIWSDASYKATFKALPLSKDTWKSTFQAAENWFVNGFGTTPTTSFKAALEAVAGALTNPQAIAIGEVWFKWRILP